MRAEAAALRDFISDVSEDVYAAGWMAGCEWDIWRAYTDWLDGKPAVWAHADISAHMPALNRLHKAAGGWVWWLDDPDDEVDGERFVSTDRWLRLLDLRERAGRRISNEDLDLSAGDG
ncbi:hypothetical protein ACFY36_31680 [Actinoplanes sp. NPDC000266]